jgi:hypothetical protein
MSDHGLHWTKTGKFNEILPGEYEHRNPMLYVISPKSSATLKSNTKRFISHYDVHQTLTGLLSGQSTKNGINLLTEEVPLGRSCKDAGVPKNWCNCFVKADSTFHLDSQEGQIQR